MRDEGTGDGAKEAARAAGGKAAGAWVIGACYGGTDVMERSCAVARGKDINNRGVDGWMRGHITIYKLSIMVWYSAVCYM
jgi:hypothetical protein